jgi:aryl-phospho-beta-D-glucosidase BglC (GH1 family)
VTGVKLGRLLLLTWIALVPIAVYSPPAPAAVTDKMAYWSVQRRGANYGGTRLRPDVFEAAAGKGIEFLRLHPDEMRPAERDFLIGNADAFTSINEADLTQLRSVLDEAEKHGVKIVLTMFSLPGHRAKKDVSDASDGRIWRQETFQEQAFAFWRELARRLKNHPAIVAYNPLNEPHPDREFGFEDAEAPAFAKWLAGVRGTAADLDRFNRKMVAAIREADPDTPIILDGWFYADASGFRHNVPVSDNRTLYALHNLGPWNYTTFRINKGQFAYPAKMPAGKSGTAVWSISNLKAIVAPVEAFAARYQIPPQRIIASEFWCDRRVEGAAAYMADELRIYDERGWHWAFYAFRGEGSWTGLDYEIPLNAPLGKLWEAEKRGEDLEPLKPRRDNPVWQVIQRELKRAR